LSSRTPKSSTLFFLGAGASIAAGVNDVRGLVKDFRDRSASNSGPEKTQRIEKIIHLLKEWLSNQEEEREVDIELVLETIDRLENIDKDIVSQFFENEIDLVTEFKDNNSHSKELKGFIRIKCFVEESEVTYFQPLMDFLRDHEALDIFSTNYDNTLEQFCDMKDIRYIDGFDSAGWNPRTFIELKEGLRIYKLHGSVTWWRTEEGDYKSIPVRNYKDVISLSSGKSAVPLILYPGKKLEYNDPYLDILFELRQQLKVAKHVIVVGYSFKDEHITRIFQYAAKKNRKFIMFLVSPSAFEIFTKKLRYYEDIEFEKGFAAPGIDSGGFTSPVNSTLGLERRVIPLSYKFEKVFPILKNKYVDNLRDAEILYEQFKTRPEESTWNEMIARYVDCEHIQKVEEIIDQSISWDALAAKDWRWSFGITLKVLINRLLSNDMISRERWNNSFLSVASILRVERFRFTPTLGHTVSFPNHIELKVEGSGIGISSVVLSEYLQGSLIPILDDKLKLVEGEALQRLRTFSDRINRLKNYCDLWRGDEMTFQSYLDLRRNNFDDVEDFRQRIREFETTAQNEQGQERVREIVEQIERNVIREIYSGDSLSL
jgi:predicted transcriptional regulator